jgi:phospholipase C
MNKKLICATPVAIAAALSLYACGGDKVNEPDISSIKTVVVIYAENRSFDNLYGNFPGANGLQNVSAASAIQVDRDGTTLATLPQVWNGLTQTGVTPVITQAMTANLPNSPFAIDDPKGFNTPITATTRDLYHRFYENQMQIDGGKNDKFAAWADSGGLAMGHYALAASSLPLWRVAQRYTLADNYFMGAFGGSFLNHFWLACACTPTYPNADKSPAKDKIGGLAALGARRAAEIRARRPDHPRFLRRQHDAAALSAEP